MAAAYLSVTLAHLGYAEQAISHGRSAVESAREAGSSSPAYALTLSVWARTLEVLRDDERYEACARMLAALAEEQGLSFLLAVGRCQLGWVTTKQGDIETGLSLLTEGLAALNRLGSSMRLEVGKYLLSDALSFSDRPVEALAMLEEVLAFSRGTGARWLDAELHRRKGELLHLLAAADQAEQEFRQAIEVARDQSARLFELRAGISLARLMSVQGRCEAARELLRPLLGWFRGEADLLDVQEARALLAGLDTTIS